MDFRLAPNQSENDKYNLISVDVKMNEKPLFQSIYIVLQLGIELIRDRQLHKVLRNSLNRVASHELNFQISHCTDGELTHFIE